MSGRLNIGVVLESEIQSGGGFQQALSTMLLIKEKSISDPTFSFKYFTTIKRNIPLLEEKGIDAVYWRIPAWRKSLALFRRTICFYVKGLDKIVKHFPIDCYFEKHKVDLLFFLAPTITPLFLEKLNFIYTLWDQCHRDHFEFPEVRNGLEFERREKKYLGILPKAFCIFVDSEKSKINTVLRYRIDEERVKIVPFLPSKLITDESELTELPAELKEIPFVFYPAQFWAHKNHFSLFYAMRELKERGFKVNCVLTGTDKGNLLNLNNLIKNLGLENEIRILGFVENNLINALFKSCSMVVMPSYFGPTNLPPLEAICFKKPIIYPSIHCDHNDFSTFVIPFDIFDPIDLTDKIESILNGLIDTDKYIHAGLKYLSHYDSDFYWNCLKDSLNHFSKKQLCWNYR